MNTPHMRPAARSFRAAFAVILGTNEIASAVAVYMHRAGWCTLLSHDPFPPVIRRRMAFHDALSGEKADVDGLPGVNAETTFEAATLLSAGGCVVVTRLGLLDLIPMSAIHVLVDARMHKREAVGDLRHLASLTVGLGPGFPWTRTAMSPSRPILRRTERSFIAAAPTRATARRACSAASARSVSSIRRREAAGTARFP